MRVKVRVNHFAEGADLSRGPVSLETVEFKNVDSWVVREDRVLAITKKVLAPQLGQDVYVNRIVAQFNQGEWLSVTESDYA
jgi:hypothetical protein